MRQTVPFNTVPSDDHSYRYLKVTLFDCIDRFKQPWRILILSAINQ